MPDSAEAIPPISQIRRSHLHEDVKLLTMVLESADETYYWTDMLQTDRGLEIVRLFSRIAAAAGEQGYSGVRAYGDPINYAAREFLLQHDYISVVPMTSNETGDLDHFYKLEAKGIILYRAFRTLCIDLI